MDTTVKPTPGPWFVHDFRAASDSPRISDITVSCDHPATITVASMNRALTATFDEALANAALIADAGTAYHRTGLMPSELAEQRDELLKIACAWKAWSGGSFGIERHSHVASNLLLETNAAIARAKGKTT